MAELRKWFVRVQSEAETIRAIFWQVVVVAVTISLFGTPVVTWRGVPLVPCDKLEMKSRYQSNQPAPRSPAPGEPPLLRR